MDGSEGKESTQLDTKKQTLEREEEEMETLFAEGLPDLDDELFEIYTEKKKKVWSLKESQRQQHRRSRANRFHWVGTRLAQTGTGIKPISGTTQEEVWQTRYTYLHERWTHL